MASLKIWRNSQTNHCCIYPVTQQNIKTLWYFKAGKKEFKKRKTTKYLTSQKFIRDQKQLSIWHHFPVLPHTHQAGAAPSLTPWHVAKQEGQWKQAEGRVAQGWLGGGKTWKSRESLTTEWPAQGTGGETDPGSSQGTGVRQRTETSCLQQKPSQPS